MSYTALETVTLALLATSFVSFAALAPVTNRGRHGVGVGLVAVGFGSFFLAAAGTYRLALAFPAIAGTIGA
jgi:hypothetical protein